MKRYSLLFFVFFYFISITWAVPRNRMKKASTLWEDAIIGPELGFGVPMGKIAEGSLKNLDVGNGKKASLKVSNTIHLGLASGYNFVLGRKYAISLKTSLLYGFTRGIEIPDVDFNISIKEHYLYFPIVVSINKKYKLPFYFSMGSFFGYEFTVPFAGKLKQTGNDKNLNPDFRGDKNLDEIVPNMPKSLGSILFGSELNFPLGIYVKLMMKMNLDIFTIDPEAKNPHQDKLDENSIKVLRSLNADYIALTIGLNIMDLFYPKEGLETKDQYKHK